MLSNLWLNPAEAQVTSMVDDHLRRCDLDTVNRDLDGKIFFSFDRLPATELQRVDTSRGFWYNQNDAVPGYYQPQPELHSFHQGFPDDPWRRRYAVGAHIASFFRRIISEQVNLACSGGVSFSKQMSKMIASANKPDKQTCFVPTLPASGAESTAQEFNRHCREDAQRFLDPLELSKLNGFGYSYTRRLQEMYQGKAVSGPISVTGPDEERSDLDWLYAHTEAVKSKFKLTVEMTRKFFSASQFEQIFGGTIGPRLWAVLNANDTEPVTLSVDPQQISIEDTYRNLQGNAVLEEMMKLSSSLIKRLEVECVERPDEVWMARAQKPVLQTLVLPADGSDRGTDSMADTGDQQVLTQVITYEDVEEEEVPQPGAGSEHTTTGTSSAILDKKSKVWSKYPLSVRLSLRIGWSARFSRTGRMPIGIFNLEQPRKARALLIYNTVVGLFRQMIATRDIAEGFNLINIAAVELSKSPPAAQDIKNMLLGAKSATGRPYSVSAAAKEETIPDWVMEQQQQSGPAIDLEMLKELPPDIAAEVAQQYGISWPLPEAKASSASAESDDGLHQSTSPSPPPGQGSPLGNSSSFGNLDLSSPAPSSPVSFPPSQISARSFSLPPEQSTPTTPTSHDCGRPGGTAEDQTPKTPNAETGAPHHVGNENNLQQIAGALPSDSVAQPLTPPPPPPPPLVTPPKPRHRFGHFELGGQEMTAEELEEFLDPSPPSPPFDPCSSQEPTTASTTTFTDEPMAESPPLAQNSEADEKAGSNLFELTKPEHRAGAKVEWVEKQTCAECGKAMFIWLQHDHEMFGESGLPPDMESAFEKLEESASDTP
ncbi:hypothetical protein OC846_004857 [Tilletia horrida]|uniref:UmuC domain-containing protein n=1 Tax=Tilletia horrida TaxID=155126 RepID=A0AAN6GLK2_9BASI|nr:hypothetical protein OC845_005583 [Tilletia horrida]KAK0547439.1 hypothetical protein OC846_004857 [Tilletia horrida]KAK0561893.1 hypothetical protein OC861_005589 [Tilletia horrida]